MSLTREELNGVEAIDFTYNGVTYYGVTHVNRRGFWHEHGTAYEAYEDIAYVPPREAPSPGLADFVFDLWRSGVPINVDYRDGYSGPRTLGGSSGAAPVAEHELFGFDDDYSTAAQTRHQQELVMVEHAEQAPAYHAHQGETLSDLFL